MWLSRLGSHVKLESLCVFLIIRYLIGTSDNSDQTVIHFTPEISSANNKYLEKPPASALPNNLQYGFRNDSYMRATHDSMSESVLLSNAGGRTLSIHPGSGDGSTVHGRQDANSVMIETDHHTAQVVSIITYTAQMVIIS